MRQSTRRPSPSPRTVQSTKLSLSPYLVDDVAFTRSDILAARAGAVGATPR